jgi:hypothetical protein
MSPPGIGGRLADRLPARRGEAGSCTLALPNRAGRLSPILERLSARFEIQSVLLLASRQRGLTLVSVGLDREPTQDRAVGGQALEYPEQQR